jgi:hypothetical protein
MRELHRGLDSMRHVDGSRSRSHLASLYAGLIIALERLAEVIKGASAKEPVVLVLSTLAIAALFRPVRNRIQLVIDRRFYRHKYDAEPALNTFRATLQSEVDLEQVREQLLTTVQQTIQPTQVSLWLRQPSQHTREQGDSVLSGERTRPLSHPHLIKNSPARW